MSATAPTSNLRPTAIHRITTVHNGGARSHRALAECPRQRHSVDVAVCASCEHARGFLGGSQRASEHARHVLCTVERTAEVDASAGTVGSLMRRDVVCVHPELDIDDIVLLFLQQTIGGVPVVDADDRPLGMISKTDLVAMYARHRGTLPIIDSFDSFDAFDASLPAAAPPAVARDLMSSVVFTLREDESIARAASFFAAKRLHRAPVVDVNGKVIGVLTSLDFVRGMAGIG